MIWRKKAGGLVFEGWTPDRIAARNEELAWAMRNNRSWSLLNGELRTASRSHQERIADDLREAMGVGRGQWKSRMRDLAVAGELVMAEGTYGALGAYPLGGSLSSLTLSTTESLALVGTNAQNMLMPLPTNGILSAQAYRYVIGAFYTVTTSPGSLVTTIRLGTANTSPSLGASAAVALTASLTNAVVLVKGDITVQQSVNVPGTNSKAVGHHQVFVNTAVGGAYNSAVWGISTAVSFDTTLSSPGANGGAVWIGMNDSGATNHAAVTVNQVHFMDWN